MYRLLEVGEVIEKGDEIWSDKKGWFSAELSIGENVPTWAVPMRRLVNPAVTPAASSVPDPGEGWRLLELEETIQQGDQYSNRVDRDWQKCLTSVSVTVEQYRKRLGDPTFSVRRRVPPVVSVGDRVKVLSGPWAGCTGVVIGSLPMNLKIKMDNVLVGGNNLTMIVGKVAVEPLPPVVPEVLYRDLSHGETIRKGDEFWMTKQGKWEPVSSSSGTKVGDNHSDGRLYFFRRPIRLQSPGWRYLDAGETVRAGDETSYSGTPDPWRPCSWCLNKPVSVGHDVYFRRKLPANQGG